MALTRSEQMARIKGRNTQPELVLRRALAAEGVRLATPGPAPVGRPDLVLARPMVAVFIDGCFWHGCPEHYVRPRSRGEFWSAKLRGNVDRDRRQTLALEEAGWRVVRIWEHEVFECLENVVARVLAAQGPRRPARRTSWRVDQVELVDAATDLELQHLVDLRDADRRETRERVRSTAKWRRRTSSNSTS